VSVPYFGDQDADSHTSEDEPPEDLFDVPGMSYPDEDDNVDPMGPCGEADV
jgi:hypothetical protein